MSYLSSFAVPLVILICALIILFSKNDAYEEFYLGVKSGLELSLSLLPTFVVLMVGVSMVSASGFVEVISPYFEFLGSKLGIPLELIPLILLRPISGSGSNAVLADIFEKYGADSYAGACASVLMASSETMIYVITVYFSSIKIKKTGYAIPAATIIMLLCIYLSCAVCRELMF